MTFLAECRIFEEMGLGVEGIQPLGFSGQSEIRIANCTPARLGVWIQLPALSQIHSSQ